MDTIPTEVLYQILLHVPPSSLSVCRLVCRSFSAIAFPIQFSFIPQWLDYKVSHRLIMALCHDAFNRPAVMWSPWASESDEPVRQEWLEVVWKLLMGCEVPTSAVAINAHGTVDGVLNLNDKPLVELGTPKWTAEGGKATIALTSANFAQLSGRDEMTEKQLKTAQNRYLLHRSYTKKAVVVPGGLIKEAARDQKQEQRLEAQ